MDNVETKTELAVPGVIKRAHCNKCLGWTKHKVLFGQSTHWIEYLDSDRRDRIDGCDTYTLLECCGCERVWLLHEHWFSEDCDDEGTIKYNDYYPPMVTRKKPDWIMMGLPIKLGLGEFGDLLDEVYSALGVKAFRVAAMGIRALVERMMIDKVGDKGTFEKNIDAFFGGGFVAPFQQDMFRNTLIEAGHAAMHRDWQPSAEDLTTLLDIVEALMKAIYVDSAKAEEVGKRLPRRRGGGAHAKKL